MTDSTNTIQVVKVRNAFNRADREIRYLSFKDGETTVRQVLLHVAPEAGDIQWNVIINGRVIPNNNLDVFLRTGDCLAVIPRVAGGGDDKGILGIIAMIALSIAAPGLANVLMGAAWGAEMTLVTAFLTGAIMIGGGLLISSMMPGASVDKGLSFDQSQSFSWSPRTMQQQGIPVPKAYGTNKIYGNIPACHTEPVADDAKKQNLYLLLCLGMGPVEGIVDGQIYVNDQLYTAFEDVVVEERRGLLNQSAISFFQTVKPEYRVNFKVTHEILYRTYVLPDADYDDLEVDILFDRGLFYANDAGGLSNHSVGIKIQIREPGGAYSTLADLNITGKDTSSLRHTFKASSTYTGGAPVTITRGNKYEVCVTKTTADLTSTRYADSVCFAAVREIINTQFTYPQTALLGVNALATEILSGDLSVCCIQKGAIVNVYKGEAQGWSLEWTDNPAWILWDLLTQPVISGDGSSGSPYDIEEYEGVDSGRLDLAKFYELALYCDDLVPDGEGGTEKRITFNGVFDTDSTLWEDVLRVCQVARCVPIWNGINITLAIDKPGNVVQSFSDGNIMKETFIEKFLPSADLINEIEIHYLDALRDYERTTLTVFEDDISNKTNKVSIDLFGITKASEAWRAGMLRLMQNKLLRSTIEFETEIDSLACTIGDVIYAQSAIPNWGMGGRVVSATSNTVTIDQDYVLESGVNKIMVKVYHPATETEVMQEKTILSVDGQIITITDTWTTVPSKDDMFMIGHEDVLLKKYRIIGLTRTSDQTARIAALKYDSAMYSNDASDPVLPLAGYTSPGSNKVPVTKPPTFDEILKLYPIDVLYAIAKNDMPIPTGLVFYDNNPSAGSVAWGACQIAYNGILYDIPGGSTDQSFIYWDPASPSQFYTTNSQASCVGSGRRVMAQNVGGTSYQAWALPIIHGGIIQANTLTAAAILAGTIDVTKLASDAVPVTTFAQDSIPIAVHAGDLWFDTNDNNKCYRATALGNDEIAAGEWVAVPPASSGNVTFVAASAPTALAAGDIWIDTAHSNQMYRATAAGSGSWVLVRDTTYAHASDTTKIDGGKIYTGSITAESGVIASISANVITVGTLHADRIVSASLTGIYSTGEVLSYFGEGNATLSGGGTATYDDWMTKSFYMSHDAQKARMYMTAYKGSGTTVRAYFIMKNAAGTVVYTGTLRELTTTPQNFMEDVNLDDYFNTGDLVTMGVRLYLGSGGGSGVCDYEAHKSATLNLGVAK